MLDKRTFGGMMQQGEQVKSKYLTIEEASEYAMVSIKTLRRKINLGLLPSYKPGKRILIDPKELEIFMRKTRKTLAS